LDFPTRIYTQEEVARANELIQKGHKHVLACEGSSIFKQKVKEAIRLIKVAGYYNFLRTYIGKIVQVDGLTQLRQAEATIWTNMYGVENSVSASSMFVQKAGQMKEYLEGELYYGGVAEKRADERRVEFLEALSARTDEESVRRECERILALWRESHLVY
jgi:hypothetical protein